MISNDIQQQKNMHMKTDNLIIEYGPWESSQEVLIFHVEKTTER